MRGLRAAIVDNQLEAHAAALRARWTEGDDKA